jgi:hypothetical protein
MLLSLALALALPAAASARPAGLRDSVAERASHAEERERRAEERAEERAARRSARNGSTDEQSTESGAPSGEGTGSPPAEAGTPSTGATPTNCQVSIEASSSRITAGETVTVSGTLACPAHVSAADRLVTVYQREGSSGFSVLANAATDAQGSFTLTPPAFYSNTVFKVRAGEHRARTVVKVAPKVTLVGPAPAALASTTSAQPHPGRRERLVFTGSVSPGQTGRLVALQVAYAAASERWQVVGFGRVDAEGDYSIAHAFRTPGAVSVRAVVHVGHVNVPGVSEPLSLDAAQPQNPQLTIEASADPIVYGQSVAISGVAGSVAGQAVTLLARTQGGTFAPVAQSSTGEAGAYTFTQTPLQSTYYRVTDATTQSTALLTGVQYAIESEAPPATATLGEQLSFSGTVTPTHAGQLVYLERETDSGVHFDVVATATVGATGAYTLPYTFDRDGANTMRVRVRASAGLQGAASKPFTISVTP